ncbi:ferrous iron transport protein B [Bacteroidota bacterium]
MTLESLTTGESGIITKIKGRGAFRHRMLEMGFVKGKEVFAIKNAPLKDPIEFKLMDYNISLRRSEARFVEIITNKEIVEKNTEKPFNGTITIKSLRKRAEEKGKIIDIALVGNPNSGKTTLFNFASGSKERVGNYAGVTVDSKLAILKHKGYIINAVDLPGTYSISAYSPEELYVRRYILNSMPDIIINVVDSSNLERNLYLTTQLIDMDVKVIIALNMYDELLKKESTLDYEFLGKMVGIPIIPTVSSKGKGIKDLFNKAIEVYENKDEITRHIHINYGEEAEISIQRIQEVIRKQKKITDKFSSRFYALKILEKDKGAHDTLSAYENYDEIKEIGEIEIQRLEKVVHEDTETYLADAKYGFIAGALKETLVHKTKKNEKPTLTERIDKYLTHKYLSFPIFLFFLWIMFQATFSLGAYPMEWIEFFVGWLGSIANLFLPESFFKDMLINGVIDGVGGVIVFLPNIVILFFFISLMEDTGYMARVAFIMDKLMHFLGLHGKSFIPLIMGFGCNVPAIMATRTIKNRGDRLVTMLILPFMSCSARLPVYILIAGAVFPNNAGNVIFSLYLFGILLSIIFAIIFKSTLFKEKEAPFVMELPPYRKPTLRVTTSHMWSKAMQYLKKMGGVILIAAIIIWLLGYFPRNVEYSKNYNRMIEQVKSEKNGTIKQLEIEKESERLEKSFIGKIGKFIEPVIRPLGFDWKMGVSLVTGMAAKEIVVSTMAVLYQAEEDSEMSGSLISNLQAQKYQNGKNKGQKVFTPLVAYSFLLFVLIYLPCIAVIVTIKREAGGWKWAAFLIFYTTLAAWLVSFIVYQVGSILLI